MQKWLIPFFLMFALITTQAMAEDVVNYDFTVNTNATYSAPYINSSVYNDTNLDRSVIQDDGFGDILQTYPSAGSTSSGSAFTNNSHYSITITPQIGNTITLSHLVYEVGKGGDSDPRGYFIRSSLDGFATDIVSEVLPAGVIAAPVQKNISLAGYNNLDSVIFRFYIWSPTPNNNSIDFRSMSFKKSTTLGTGNPSSYKVTVTKVELWNGTSWVEVFSGTAQLDIVKNPGAFPGINNVDLPFGTYSKVRVTFNNSFPVTCMTNYGGTNYYTTATTFGGQTNIASTPTTTAGSAAEFIFRNPAWKALNADVMQEFDITPITVGGATDYQPTLRFTITTTAVLMGAAGSPTSYYLTLGAPTASLVEP